MIIDDNSTIDLISTLATIQRHVMRTMLATTEDYIELQPALVLLISAQGTLTDALDNDRRMEDEFQELITNVQRGSEFCEACADQESIAAPGESIYCRRHRE
jgi:hypothetical protein